MDPDANLKEQLKIAELMREGVSLAGDYPDRLVELVLALDEWIVKGGALPERWCATRGRRAGP